MQLPRRDLSHALALLRSWYPRRHQDMQAETEAHRLPPRAMHLESRMLTWILSRVESAAREAPPEMLPGYRYPDTALLACLDDQIERLIVADAVSIADIEALAQARSLFMGDEPEPAALDLEINLAGLLYHPQEQGDTPC